MGDVQNLQNEEAIAKIKELAKDQTCHFCTFTGAYELRARPMSTSAIEDDGSIYFFSGIDSGKNDELEQQPKVHLLYGNPGSSSYLSVAGEAAVVTDESKIDELYTPVIKAWFQGGKDDPEISLIRVTPTEAYYWDTKHGKVVSFLKIMASVVTGKTMDDGIEGKLEV